MSKQSLDFDIRCCLVNQFIAQGISRSDIRHELTLDSSSSGGRSDMTVFYLGKLHGIEIKSAADTLERLKLQRERYERAFDCVHIVVDKKHIEPAQKIAYWAEAYCHEKRGLVSWNYWAKDYTDIQLNLANSRSESRETTVISMAHLLWRSETESITDQLGCKRKTRVAGINYIRENTSLAQLRPLIVQTLRQRILSAWESSFWHRYDKLAQVTA